MRTRIILSIGCFILVLSGCNYFKNVALLTQGRVGAKNFRVSFPFTYERGLIIVQVLLGDDPTPRPFIFDSGAFNSKIEAELAGALGFQVGAIKTNSDSQGNEQEIEVVQMDSLKLGELNFYNIGAGKLTWDSLSASPCLADGGIIGANLMKLANWQIDYATQMITVSDQAFEPSATAIHIPFRHPVFSGTPEIDLNIEGRKVSHVLLDLGSNGSLRLPFSLESSFEGTRTLRLADASNSGIYGITADSIVVKTLPIQMGEQTHTLPVSFEGEGKGLLGNEILQHYRVTLNYKGNDAYLEPYDVPPTPEPKFTFIPGVLTEDLWVVNRAQQGSRWNLGDTLTHVNRLRPHEVFDTYCDFFLGIRDILTAPEGLEVTTQQGEVVRVEAVEDWE
ncbi:MAG: aspartyl protease family protein [Bacteroidota bacterium]